MVWATHKVNDKLANDSLRAYIDLSNEGLDDLDIDNLVKLLQQHPNKDIKLNLYANNLSDFSAIALATLENISEINLGYNNIGNNGLKALINNFKINSIDLSDNTRINEECIEYLLHNTKQYYLTLSNTKISRDNKEKINIILQNNRTKISGELLRCFDQLLYDELETFYEINDFRKKKLLTNILFDSLITNIQIVANYAIVVAPQIGRRFAILYCCIYPKHWDDPYIQDLKIPLFDSFIDRFFNNGKDSLSQEYRERIEWLKQRANKHLIDFFQARKITNLVLDDAEQQEKRDSLLFVPSVVKDPKESENYIRHTNEAIDELINLIKLEDSEPINFSEQPKTISIDITNLQTCIWKKIDSISTEQWTEIYNLLKVSSKGEISPFRSEEKMLKMLKAILYKEEMKCSWYDLPQSLPPYTTVSHYYYEWKKNKALEKTLDILTKNVVNKQLQQGTYLPAFSQIIKDSNMRQYDKDQPQESIKTRLGIT